MSQQQYQNYNNGNYKLINFNVPHYLINNFDEIVKFKRISRTSVLIGLMERYIGSGPINFIDAFKPL